MLGRLMAVHMGWEYQSTDKLGRHPGRPWGEALPAHVVKHYSGLSVKLLMADVLNHYRKNVFPKIKGVIKVRLNKGRGMVLEGSAILPELSQALKADELKFIWLTAPDNLIRRRIYRESGYEKASQKARLLIDKFTSRSLSFNQWIQKEISVHGLNQMDMGVTENLDELIERCVEFLDGASNRDTGKPLNKRL